MHTVKLLIIGLVILVLACSAPVDVFKDVAVELGESVQTQYLQVTVRLVDEAQEYSRNAFLGDTFVYRPSQGMKYLILEAEAENIGMEPVFVITAYFWAANPAGQRKNAGTYFAPSELPILWLQRGETIQGKVLLEVSESWKQVYLIYDFGKWGDCEGVWRCPWEG